MSIEAIRRSVRKHHPRVADDGGLIRASVLIPLVQSVENLQVLLTVRTEDVEHHKGQISFPGGAVEPADSDIYQTALREAEEELGISSADVDVIGRIDDLATPTGFVVSAVVGYIASLPPLRPQPEEVSEYFLAPLAFFLDDANGYTRDYRREKDVVKVWFYEYEEYTVWGVTAAIIRNFKQVLESGTS
ncbi:MAG TPA: CoA pyrophosphatase [bacterium]|nr:CoA pyrophosphatase [bacterium]